MFVVESAEKLHSGMDQGRARARSAPPFQMALQGCLLGLGAHTWMTLPPPFSGRLLKPCVQSWQMAHVHVAAEAMVSPGITLSSSSQSW